MLDAEARHFLESQRLAHLATADAAGQPHVIPVCFAVLGDAIYVVIDDKPKRGSPMRLRRVRNVVENPRVALVADVYDDDWSKLGFVLVRGMARLLEAGEEHARALLALRARYEQYRAMRLEDRPMIVLDVAHVTAWGIARAD